ncbi:two-component system LytT family sensor kinase [Dysgonomonas sp. PFB1-18]|uniref:sensor histidine kinase n=1 Tax=unclassified Dysgonomonas TaxID=2630389 RepID=UPI002474C223|nr:MULTISPECIES: histidine kinase [unclassified Dysgonomonas]MDH6307647.1 two-component system LytT family sensor kinase [Dysgonomonas sp. PF1-14]MDH6337565.1 two-component system LytT family sensor kinase [Dysgonomonas sp. PF1-16]MDH6378789.1 two-component system LytT family sensor kinase [Dysgonomonas sp. PFB1-18]MDH6399207.1 two-component system LytT family sensor kinase [Dysgonomonas sp. PF1-23]
MNKKHILLFILITALIQLMCQAAFMLLNADYTKQDFLFQYLINLPASIFIGAIDFLIINTVYKRLRLKDNAIRVLTDLVITSLFVIAFAIIGNYILSPLNIFDYITRLALSLIVWNTIMVLLIEIFFYNQRQADTEKRLAIAEKEKIQYQYETLKAQVNPHFLFNSLNVLSSLAYESPDKTNLFAKKMSGVYRYLLLTNDKPIVTLKEELSFLESYIFLEQVRFEDALHIEIIKDDNSSLNKYIIPVSLQLIAENAIKHNITTKDSPLTIRFHITSENIIISNNLQLRSSVDKGGVGLSNLQKQYSLHNKIIDITQSDTEFIVKIPFISSL